MVSKLLLHLTTPLIRIKERANPFFRAVFIDTDGRTATHETVTIGYEVGWIEGGGGGGGEGGK